MRIRRLQHQQVCSPTGNEIVIAEFPILEAKCQEEACRVETIDRASRLYEEDLIAQGFDKPCTAVARNFRMVAEEARKKEEFAKYGSCVKRLVNSLDDQKSGADVIAQGLHSTCKDALSSNVSLSDDLKQTLIQIVLEARSSRRKK
jgi:hypothetical protein